MWRLKSSKYFNGTCTDQEIIKANISDLEDNLRKHKLTELKTASDLYRYTHVTFPRR